MFSHLISYHRESTNLDLEKYTKLLESVIAAGVAAQQSASKALWKALDKGGRSDSPRGGGQEGAFADQVDSLRQNLTASALRGAASREGGAAEHDIQIKRVLGRGAVGHVIQ